MYDPSVGRWLEEDPMGFNAGDSNLYRYAGNQPTDKTDPSGLEIPGPGYHPFGPPIISPQEEARRREVQQRLHDEYLNRRLDLPGYPIHIIINGGDINQRRIAFERITEAIRQIDRAAYILENLWRVLAESPFAADAHLNIFRDPQNMNEVRRFVANIINTRNNLRTRGTIQIPINETPGAGRGNDEPWGYVVGWVGWTIYLNPRFYLGRPYDNPNANPTTGDDLIREQVHTCVWELGRLIPGITSDRPLSNDIIAWITMIQFLAGIYDGLRAWDFQNNPDFQLDPPGPRLVAPEQMNR